jgi:hypothetical protein
MPSDRTNLTLDEQSFQGLLAAAFTIQEHNDRRNPTRLAARQTKAELPEFPPEPKAVVKADKICPHCGTPKADEKLPCEKCGQDEFRPGERLQRNWASMWLMSQEQGAWPERSEEDLEGAPKLVPLTPAEAPAPNAPAAEDASADSLGTDNRPAPPVVKKPARQRVARRKTRVTLEPDQERSRDWPRSKFLPAVTPVRQPAPDQSTAARAALSGDQGSDHEREKDKGLGNKWTATAADDLSQDISGQNDLLQHDLASQLTRKTEAEEDSTQSDLIRPDLIRPDLIRPDLIRPDLTHHDLVDHGLTRPRLTKADMTHTELGEPELAQKEEQEKASDLPLRDSRITFPAFQLSPSGDSFSTAKRVGFRSDLELASELAAGYRSEDGSKHGSDSGSGSNGESDDGSGVSRNSVIRRFRDLRVKLRFRRADLYLGTAIFVAGFALLWPAAGSPRVAKPSLSAWDQALIALGIAEAPPAPEVHLQGDPGVKVWIDPHTALYYCPGEEQYGQAANGRFSSQREAQMDRFEPAGRSACE